MELRPSEDGIAFGGGVLVDPELRALRQSFCEIAAHSLGSIASWLGVDALLGGGDFADGSSHRGNDVEPTRYDAFRALAAVVEMASELAVGATALRQDDRRFAAAALTRQLIETEYLLKSFAIDFSTAAKWFSSSPEEIRRLFAPKTMRTIGGFSNTEYWHHCDMGGHPAPQGRALLHF